MGGIINPPWDYRLKLVKKMTTQVVNNSAVLVDDNALSATLAGDHYYSWMMYLRLISTAVADTRINIVAPGSDTATVYLDYLGNTRSYGTNWFLAGSGAGQCMFMIGDLVLVGAGGTFKLQWAQQTAEVSDTTVYEGSYLIIHDMGVRP